MITPDGVILSTNLAFAKMMEAPREAIVGKTFFEFLRIGWNQVFFDFLHRSDEKSRTAEISLSSKSGKEISALLTINAVLSENSLWISLTDRTAQKLTEETLRRTQQRLNTVAELNSDAIWELDGLTREIWRSDGFAELLGYPAHAIKPTTRWWKENIHPDDRAMVAAELERLMDTGEGGFKKSYRLRKQDGTYAEVVDQAVAIRDKESNAFRVIGSIVDVTEEKKAESAQREISRNILDAQEQERKRVARELHDGVSQLLAASVFSLHTVQKQVTKAHPALAKKVSEAQELVERAHREVQLISRNLRPSELDDLGLSAALRSLCADFKKRTNLKISLETELSSKTLKANVELTIYRIVQEALNNVEKHARAKKVRITLTRDTHEIFVKVADDGKGFDPQKVRERSRCGLDNIRERASFLNGSVTWLSHPAKGTTMTLVLPVT